jgi:hypothetical protein
MRLSVLKDDPGYNPRWAYKACPFLDGEFVSNVITADQENGYLIRYKTDRSGDVVVDYQRGEIEKEILRGHIDLRFKTMCEEIDGES